jgi:hypothetical protein
MYMACRHIMPNERRCKSPALKRALFCYFHARIHKLGNHPYSICGKLHFPVAEDAAAIQLSIMQICDALATATISYRPLASSS